MALNDYRIQIVLAVRSDATAEALSRSAMVVQHLGGLDGCTIEEVCIWPTDDDEHHDPATCGVCAAERERADAARASADADPDGRC